LLINEWQVNGKMTCWQNDKLTICHVDEMASWQMTSWQMTSWQMTSWQNDKLAK
jgi:hypothetical protein